MFFIPQILWSASSNFLLIDSFNVFKIRSLSNDDGNVNENGKKKKTIVLDWQNNNFARASRVFVHFFAVTARLRCENA